MGGRSGGVHPGCDHPHQEWLRPRQHLADITTLLTVDHIMQAVRQMLTEKLRGVRSSQQSLESVASQVTVLLRQKEEEGLLEDWSDRWSIPAPRTPRSAWWSSPSLWPVW